MGNFSLIMIFYVTFKNIAITYISTLKIPAGCRLRVYLFKTLLPHRTGLSFSTNSFRHFERITSEMEICFLYETSMNSESSFKEAPKILAPVMHAFDHDNISFLKFIHVVVEMGIFKICITISQQTFLKIFLQNFGKLFIDNCRLKECRIFYLGNNSEKWNYSFIFRSTIHSWPKKQQHRAGLQIRCLQNQQRKNHITQNYSCLRYPVRSQRWLFSRIKKR